MPTRGAPRLDPSFLISQARGVVDQVASVHEIYVSPNAMQGVDSLVHDRIDELNRLAELDKFDLDKWKTHVEHTANSVAIDMKNTGQKRLTSPQELRQRAEQHRIYPYD